MARRVKFPLKMKNGAEVRAINELKENFDLESVLGYFAEGKLEVWLADRYYDEKAKAVSALSKDMPDLNEKLCEILEVEYQSEEDSTDLEYIQRQREKYQILAAYTDNKDILDNVDIVAMSQDELFNILDSTTEKVYLYEKEFEIPLGRKNVLYIGIKSPLVILEKNKTLADYSYNGIEFKDVKFEESVNPYITAGEKLFLEGKQKEAFPRLEKAAASGNPRAMYLMALYYAYGYETVKINDEDRNNWVKKAYEYKEPLSMYGYAFWCLKNNSDEQKEIYRNIFDEIKELAENGDAFASWILGIIYECGICVEQNYKKAVSWYRKAAEQGYANAQNSLAIMYQYGNGVTQDYSKAVEWYRKAAEQGNANAQYNLGVIHYKGDGVTQDYSKAVEWYRKAAEQGYADAQCNLGYMYEHGYGVKQDKSKAVEWYRKAAEQGLVRGQYNLGFMYDIGNGVTQDKSKAIEWYRKAAEQGDAYAQCNLGYMYDMGYGVTQDKSKAIEWYRKAAEQGNETAKNNLKNIGECL